MAKRKITVTVDADLVDELRAGEEAMSAVVNQALAAHYERRARQAALGDLLAEWESRLGPIPEHAAAEARAAFDEADGIAHEASA